MRTRATEENPQVIICRVVSFVEEEELVLISLKEKIYFGSDGQHLLSGVPRAAEQNFPIEACCVLEVTA